MEDFGTHISYIEAFWKVDRNDFETEGLMTVILFVSGIIFFLGLDWMVRRVKLGRNAALEPHAGIVPSYPMRTPQGIFFAKSHTWLSLFPSGRVRLGIDDFLGGLMEKPQITFLKKAGDVVEKGDPVLTIGEGARQVTVRSPLSGEVLGLNGGLMESPSRMRENLFSEGWAYSIRPDDLQELRAMMIGSESRSWMLNEICRLRAFLTAVGGNALVPATIQDGGTPSSTAMRNLDDGRWAQFEEQFLQVR